MAHRFTFGERKIWQNIKKSQNIMKMIVGTQTCHEAPGDLWVEISKKVSLSLQ